MGRLRTIGIQVLVDDDKERTNKIIQALREADKDLSLEYNDRAAVYVRKYAINNSNSSDDINQKARESLKKIVDTLLSMDKHIKFKPLWY